VRPYGIAEADGAMAGGLMMYGAKEDGSRWQPMHGTKLNPGRFYRR
jgi:hypothetical protein